MLYPTCCPLGTLGTPDIQVKTDSSQPSKTAALVEYITGAFSPTHSLPEKRDKVTPPGSHLKVIPKLEPRLLSEFALQMTSLNRGSYDLTGVIGKTKWTELISCFKCTLLH